MLPRRGSSVGDWLNICPWVASRVAQAPNRTDADLTQEDEPHRLVMRPSKAPQYKGVPWAADADLKIEQRPASVPAQPPTSPPWR